MTQVTAIIPNYDHARFLEQRIESALGQTHTDLDALILDDGSTDARQAAAEGLSFVSGWTGSLRTRGRRAAFR